MIDEIEERFKFDAIQVADVVLLCPKHKSNYRRIKMGKVYAPPAEIKKPDFMSYIGVGMNDIDGYYKAEAEYFKQVSEYAKKNGSGKLAGEEINFPVADGYARYIVYSTSPVVLLHLETGDGWQYQYANRLTASDIKERVRCNQAIRNIFSKKASA